MAADAPWPRHVTCYYSYNWRYGQLSWRVITATIGDMVRYLLTENENVRFLECIFYRPFIEDL